MKAPEFVGITAWLNSKPLKMAQLRGKVVLIDFWTYSCVNCVRTFPHLIQTYKKYKDLGFVLVGVHSPEFDFEKDTKNIRKAIKKFKIPYPVANDANMQTWRAFRNQYWPRQYLIDKDGEIRWDHAGEGGYAEIEQWVRDLLTEVGVKKLPPFKPEQERRRLFGRLFTTPETYCGAARNESLGGGQVCTPKGCKFVDSSPVHHTGVIYLDGEWAQTNEYLQHKGTAEGYILLKYSAKEVNLVMDADKKSEVKVFLDDKPINKSQYGPDVKNGKLIIDHPDMYRIVQTPKAEEHELKLVTKGPVKCFAYTFG